MLILRVIWTFVVFLFFLGTIAVAIWATVDAARRPREAFSLAGSSKGLWVTLLVVFDVLAFFVSTVLGVVYLVSIRPRVAAAQRTTKPVDSSGVSSPTVTPTPLPGWYPDPMSQHEFRFWDGAKWTDRVEDGGLEHAADS